MEVLHLQSMLSERTKMVSSPVKTSVIALSADAVNRPELAGWRHLVTDTKFVLQPCKGIKVVISPGWTFKGWYAYSQPIISIESNLLSNTFKSVLGRKPKYPPVMYRYQQLWQRTERASYRPEFWEDVINKTHEGERSVGEVTDYIVELVDDYEKYVATKLDFASELALLRSLPEAYEYVGYPMQDALLFLLTRCILGDQKALEEFFSNPPMPAGMLKRVAQDIERIRVAALKLHSQ